MASSSDSFSAVSAKISASSSSTFRSSRFSSRRSRWRLAFRALTAGMLLPGRSEPQDGDELELVDDHARPGARRAMSQHVRVAAEPANEGGDVVTPRQGDV